LKDERKPTPFLQTPFNETQARFSPDGRCRSPPVPPPEKAITGLSLLTASASRQLPRPKPRTSRPNVGDPQHGGGGRRKRLLAPELAAGISRLKSAKTQGIRTESLRNIMRLSSAGQTEPGIAILPPNPRLLDEQ